MAGTPLTPPQAPVPTSSASSAAAAAKRRKWRDKFGDALRGLKLGVRGHSSFFVHFFFAALVLLAAIVLQCGLIEWCLLLLCIGMVLTAELFNSAIETLFRGLDERTKSRGFASLDIAAGAVLVASITAALIGSMVFLYRLGELFDWNLLGSGS
jgi:diacylglycerol kinase